MEFRKENVVYPADETYILIAYKSTLAFLAAITWARSTTKRLAKLGVYLFTLMIIIS